MVVTLPDKIGHLTIPLYNHIREKPASPLIVIALEKQVHPAVIVCENSRMARFT